MPLQITSESDLIDDLYCISGNDLPISSKVTLTAKTVDAFGISWRSQATFLTDEKGQVDLAKKPPISGDYRHVDPMGLIWSMRPEKTQQSSTLFLPANNNFFDITFVAKSAGKIVARKTIQRKLSSEVISQQSVSCGRVKGELFLPKGEGPHPAILLYSGSNGGVKSQLGTAALLASRGFTVFVQAYYNYEDLSKELYEVPIEIFAEGVTWLQQQPNINENKISAMAWSKGAEGLLVAAAYLNLPLKAIIAIAPSNVIWQGVGKGKPKVLSSWAYQDKPLTFLPYESNKIIPQFLLNTFIRKVGLQKAFSKFTRINLLSIYECIKKNILDEVLIPVEKINAPLLLIAGNEDRVWPSVYMSQSIINHRASSKFSSQDEFITFDGAGHFFRFPYLPASVSWYGPPGAKMVINFGGNTRANAKASRESWQKILEFLQKYL